MPWRTSTNSALLAAVLATGASGGHASDESPASRLIGSWVCDSGACPDEEIAFSIVDGVRTYDSWLHERPSASGGSWALNGDRLNIQCCAGIEYNFVVVRVTETELVLREADTSEEALLTRVPEAGGE